MEKDSNDDFDLLGVFFILWVVSVANLAFVIARHETWSGVTTLTAILALWLPWVMGSSILARIRRLRRR